MTDTPGDGKPTDGPAAAAGAASPDPAAPAGAPSAAPVADTAELQSEMHRILVDHEMERGMTITRIPQPQRRRRGPSQRPSSMPPAS